MRYALILFCLLFSTNLVMAGEYYAIFFSHDTNPVKPALSHTWATFVQVNKHKVTQEFTISWFPVRQWQILQGKVSGHNKTLFSSCRDALTDREHPREVQMWGPYVIDEKWFNRARDRFDDLNSRYKYKAFDHLTRYSRHPAVNCIHAVSDIVPGLNTGIKYGQQATQAIVDHFSKFGVLQPSDDRELINELGLAEFPVIIRK